MYCRPPDCRLFNHSRCQISHASPGDDRYILSLFLILLNSKQRCTLPTPCRASESAGEGGKGEKGSARLADIGREEAERCVAAVWSHFSRVALLYVDALQQGGEPTQ